MNGRSAMRPLAHSGYNVLLYEKLQYLVVLQFWQCWINQLQLQSVFLHSSLCTISGGISKEFREFLKLTHLTLWSLADIRDRTMVPISSQMNPAHILTPFLEPCHGSDSYCWPAAETQVQTQENPCGGQRGTRMDFSPNTAVFSLLSFHQ